MLLQALTNSTANAPRVVLIDVSGVCLACLNPLQSESLRCLRTLYNRSHSSTHPLLDRDSTAYHRILNRADSCLIDGVSCLGSGREPVRQACRKPA
jgi:hypothetical protein